MPETLVPLRNALAEAYMGDTKVVKDLFSSHETYDQRMVEILTGLGQHVDVRQPSAISTADIKALMAVLHATSNSDRIARLTDLLSRNSSTYDTFNFDPQYAFLLTEVVLGSGYIPFKKGLTSIGIDTAPLASVMIRRHPLRGALFDFNIPFEFPVSSFEHLTGNRFKFGLIVDGAETFHLPFVGVSRSWVPCSLVRSARSEINSVPGFFAQISYEEGFAFGGTIGTKPALTFTVRTSSGTYLNWTDIWTNGTFEPIDGSVASISMSFNAL